MITLFFNQFLGGFRKILGLNLFSKKRAADLIFFFHFFLISLPVLAIPDPDVDLTLGELRSRFIQEIGAQPFDDKQKFPLEIRGDYLGVYGLPQDKVSLYKPDTPTRTSTLVLRIPKEGYLDRQGLYHAYRLLFGDGYIVPSMLVQFKDMQNNKTWILEVLPQIKPLPRLEDLKDHYSSYSLGVHFLGSIFFPRQSFPSQSFNILRGEKIVVVRRGLGPQDCLESEAEISISPFFLEMRSVLISGQLKNNLKKQKANYFIPHWLSSLSEEEKRAHALGHTENLQLKEQTLHTLATRLQKMIGLALLPSDLSYGEIETLTKEASTLVDKQLLMGIKALSLLTLNHIFFSHEQQDWTEVFEILGETFGAYGGYFTKQAHRLKDPSLLKEALQKNRNSSVLTFMLQGGLQPRDLGEMLVEVVRCSGQRLDTPRALDWIIALGKAGVPLEHKDAEDNTALDIAFQQRKHALIKTLIERGAGAEAHPHLTIDYLSSLKEKSASFDTYLDLLEFRNYRLRWQLTLESLFPLHTGKEQRGLVIKTTDGQRELSPRSVTELWNKGNVNPKHFLSFTETSDPTQKKYGRHTVGKITNGRYTLYVKQYPELPGIEEAVGMLTRQLLGYGAPNTLLANISGTAYLFSEGVPGRPLQDYLTGKTEVPWSHVSDHLDPESLSGMILLAMLTNPEDGKPDNYMVQECPDGTYRIIGIDNDHAFVPSVSTIQGKRMINVKSVLFALDQMKQALHPALKRKFLYHNPRETLEEWIKTLMQRSKQYEDLFASKEVMTHFEDHESFLGIALHPSIVIELYKNLSSLQHLVASEEHLTHMDLLRRLHKSIYLRYKEGHEKFPEASPLERFTHVDGNAYNLSKNKEFQTMSTGSNLLSSNMMITTQKDLFDYVNKKRGQEIRLDAALKTLKEIAEQDTHLLAEQAMNQAGAKIPLEQMTDLQRESFLKELDWSKLPIANQQALLDQITKVSYGDPKQNLSPWRGTLTFKNCQGFPESTFLTKGFDQKMNWENIYEVRLIMDNQGGREAYLRMVKALQNTHVPLNIELKDLMISDEELDFITTQGKLTKLALTNCQRIKDPILREHAPNLVWKKWSRLDENFRPYMRKVIVEDLLALNLNLNGIEDAGMKALAGVLKDTQLQTLDLSDNKMGDAGVKVLAGVLKDTQLQELDLGVNNIGDEGAKALAAVLKDSQIQTLNLYKNWVGDAGAQALAAVLKDSKVQTLDLSKNWVKDEGAKALARGLKDSKVQTLNLGDNKIGDSGVQALAAVLKDSQVQTLNLRGNKTIDAGAQALAAGLKDSKVQTLALDLDGAAGVQALAAVLKDSRVQTLNLWGNKIGDSGAQALAAVLKDSQVQTLGLGNNNIGDSGAQALAAGLKDSKVQTLDLSMNEIGDSGAQALAAGLKDSKVQTLDLARNEIGAAGTQALAAVLKDFRLQTLDLGHNKIGDSGARALAVGLKDTKLQTLDLYNNEIGAEGARMLAIVLKDTQLQTLNLGDNKIGNEGAQALATVLKDSQLQTLNLYKNDIGDEGAKALAAVLKDSKVQTLDLDNNEIGDEGAQALADVLKDSKVQKWNLFNNNIGDEGAKALADGLKDSQVQTLNLEANEIGDEGAQALAAVLKDTQLQTLNLASNKIGDTGAQALAAVLKDSQVQTLDLNFNKIGDAGVQSLADGLKDSQVQDLDLECNNAMGAEGKKAKAEIEAILKQNRKKYGPLPSEVSKKEDAPQNRSLQTPRTKSKISFLSQEGSLEFLLSEAGLRGNMQQNVFRSDVARAQYLLEQGNPDTYPTILKILEQSLNPRMKPKPKHFNQRVVLKSSLMGLEEEVETDTLSTSLSNPQESLSLLNKLSQVYPRALLSLVEIHHTFGNTQEEMEALSQSLNHQIPGTLERIESLYNSDGYVGYALLMAENYLQGYMSPQNLDHGEAWLRAALEKDPTNPDIQTQLAQVLLEKGGLEDTRTYAEIQTLLTRAKEQHHGGALSLSLMIQEIQNNRKVKDLPISQRDQLYTAREQRLLRALHQSQFGKPKFEVQDLTREQKHQLEEVSDRHGREREKIMETIECAETDLTKSSPLDKPAIEENLLKLKQNLNQAQEKQHQEIKRVLFPKGITSSPLLKQFYEGLSKSIRQQLSLLDAIEGGLADRKEKFSEKQLKDAIATAVGYAGNMIISNIPIPASGILAMVVEKVTSMGIDKITKILQSKVSESYDAEADKARQCIRDVTQNYQNNNLVANGLSALYVYRLQNMILYLTEKGAKDLSTRLSASVVSYLQDKKRITSPQNLTQLMVMSFYHNKGISVGEALAKARGTHGLKKTDGTIMDYDHVFGSPLIETTDGAQYQVLNHNTKKGGREEALLQIVPLIEKEILQNKKLQGIQTKLEEKCLPQLSPFQVEIIKEQDDTDYARKALDFAASLYGEKE